MPGPNLSELHGVAAITRLARPMPDLSCRPRLRAQSTSNRATLHLTEFATYAKHLVQDHAGECEGLHVNTNTPRKNSDHLSDTRSIETFHREETTLRFPPKITNFNPQGAVPISLRMYTEEEVAAILQVSMSQLRKWRMKHQTGTHHGPPFKKIGRLVRYPQKALQAYVDED